MMCPNCGSERINIHQYVKRKSGIVIRYRCPICGFKFSNSNKYVITPNRARYIPILLSKGFSVKDIAFIMNISTRRVQSYLKKMNEILEVKDDRNTSAV
ncbi:MAG: hypothetical protein QXW35_03465 [Candidatus Aenigmatarchaeota archaeon]